ncbi:hypothetical protein [Paraburkholderia guartelaensis]|uniref:hypothetical protein n=1 Tax=Paraburkholderia guartelaensis TaxID=2546446 RepID=UPI002AB6AB66|nr:hypothetical protein [Paraburkholderia guartelaensis]
MTASAAIAASTIQAASYVAVQSNPQSTWLTVVQVGAAALSPVIAVVGGWIAWQQVRINRNKLKLDRFDRRFEIYEAAMSFVASIVTHGSVREEWRGEFQLKSRGALFLVSKEIDQYVEELLKMSNRLVYLTIQLQTPLLTDAKREELGSELTNVHAWFHDQWKIIPEKFAPYLAVDDI